LLPDPLPEDAIKTAG